MCDHEVCKVRFDYIREGIDRIDAKTDKIWDKLDEQGGQIQNIKDTGAKLKNRVSVMEKDKIPASAWVPILKQLGLLIGAMTAVLSGYHVIS